MQWRIIDISDEPVQLNVRYDQLVIKGLNAETTVPLEEIAVLIVAQPRVQFSQSVLGSICANGGSFIVCDERRMPIGQILPLAANFIQTEKFAAQINTSIPMKKQIWAQIVRAKVYAQGKLLKKIHGDDFGLYVIAKKVRSGDLGNIEALAARRYWPVLFSGDFRRIPGADDSINSFLNYGYAILRSLISRAICASGLHPSIGIHHHNRYNPFCLSDDIMEPYRPIIDEIVIYVKDWFGPGSVLDKDAKKLLLDEIISRKVNINKEARSLFDAAYKTAASLADVFESKRIKLTYPEP